MLRKFKQNKLWRDKTIEILEKEGSRIRWKFLDDDAFIKQLGLKLLEEAEEVALAKNRSEIINELADVCEVIDTIAKMHNISKNEILEVQTIKQKERGGFCDRKFVEISEHPSGSFAEQYCLMDPKKYPEIT